MNSEEKALRKGMTDKVVSFCQEYAVDKNGCQAAIRAGYSERSAKEIASENLTKPNIVNYVDYLLNKNSIRAQVDAVYVIKGLKKVADRCTDDDTFEHAGANRSLELLGKHIGMFTEKVEVSGSLDLTGMSDDELRDELKDE